MAYWERNLFSPPAAAAADTTGTRVFVANQNSSDISVVDATANTELGRIKLTGKGPGGADVVVTVRLEPHALFTRRGADLERELPLTLGEALLGAEVSVATLKGRLLLKIPAGTQAGKTFRLKGQGMPHLKGDAVGDLYVKVRVVLPSALDEPAREAALRFLDLVHQPDPRAGS